MPCPPPTPTPQNVPPPAAPAAKHRDRPHDTQAADNLTERPRYTTQAQTPVLMTMDTLATHTPQTTHTPRSPTPPNTPPHTHPARASHKRAPPPHETRTRTPLAQLPRSTPDTRHAVPPTPVEPEPQKYTPNISPPPPPPPHPYPTPPKPPTHPSPTPPPTTGNVMCRRNTCAPAQHARATHAPHTPARAPAPTTWSAAHTLPCPLGATHAHTHTTL